MELKKVLVKLQSVHRYVSGRGMYGVVVGVGSIKSLSTHLENVRISMIAFVIDRSSVFVV